MDGLSAHNDDFRIEFDKLDLGGSRYDEDYEREETSGDTGREEVL